MKITELSVFVYVIVIRTPSVISCHVKVHFDSTFQTIYLEENKI